MRLMSAFRCAIASALVAGLLTTVPAWSQSTSPEDSKFESFDTVVMQGLDKITARVWTFEVPVNSPARFGTLDIVASTCRSTPPEETPESAAFLEIIDHREDASPELLFRGWMFASSPALSSLEHPVYDVWVLDCR